MSMKIEALSGAPSGKTLSCRGTQAPLVLAVMLAKHAVLSGPRVIRAARNEAGSTDVTGWSSWTSPNHSSARQSLSDRAKPVRYSLAPPSALRNSL
jgi:hypothetical protein